MKFIRKMTSIIAAGTILSVSAAASAESPASGDAAGSGVWTDIAGETSTSYDNLFDVILDENTPTYGTNTAPQSWVRTTQKQLQLS